MLKRDNIEDFMVMMMMKEVPRKKEENWMSLEKNNLINFFQVDLVLALV
jgi:hypothetical protein